MKKPFWVVLAVALMAFPSVSLSQNAGPPDDAGFRPRNMRPRRGPNRRGGPEFMLQRMTGWLTRSLDLTEEQEAALKEIVADYQERLAAGRMPGQGREMWEAYREAQANGDEARLEELREQMREMRAQREAVMEELFTEVEQILEPDQVERLARFRQRFEEGRQRMRQRGQLRRLLRELPQKMDLSEEQQANLDEIVDDLRAQREARRERWRELRPLMEDLREARETGDEARAEEIRQQLEAARAESGTDLDAIRAQIEAILTDEQKPAFADLWEQSFGTGSSTAAETPRQNDLTVRDIMRAVQRLKLDRDQSRQARELIQTAMRESRRLGRREKAAQHDLVLKLKSDIEALLTPDQKESFEQLLENGGRSRPRMDRPRRPWRDTP